MIELLINEYVQLKTYLMFFISFRHYKCSLKNVTPPMYLTYINYIIAHNRGKRHIIT